MLSCFVTVSVIVMNLMRYCPILCNIIIYYPISLDIWEFCQILPCFVQCHLVTKQSFCHFLSYILNTKSFFTKRCSVWYAFWLQSIKSESLAINWSHSSRHFVTFWTKHQIKKFFYNSCSVWYAMWDYHIKSES